MNGEPKALDRLDMTNEMALRLFPSLLDYYERHQAYLKDPSERGSTEAQLYWDLFEKAEEAVEKAVKAECVDRDVPWPLADAKALAAADRLADMICRFLLDSRNEDWPASQFRLRARSAAMWEFEMLALARRDRPTLNEEIAADVWRCTDPPTDPADALIALASRQIASEVMVAVYGEGANELIVSDSEQLALFNRIADIVVASLVKYHRIRPKWTRRWWSFWCW